MKEIYDQPRRRKRKARERNLKRKARREILKDVANEGLEKLPDLGQLKAPGFVTQLGNIVSDTIWHFKKSAPVGLLVRGIGGFVLVLIVFFILTTLFSRDIGPNISTMGITLSGQTVEEATETLFSFWNEEATIDIRLGEEVFESVRPSGIGILLDATATAEAAKGAGLSGFPFGVEIEPVLSADYGDVQAYILSIANETYVPAYEAGYEWRDGALVSVAGTASRELDVVESTQRIVDAPLQIIMDGSVSLVTSSTPPSVVDADPYFEQAVDFVTSDFLVEGYDPFRDEMEYWATTRQEMADWLVVTDTGLAIREQGLEDFVNQINSRLDTENWSRYIDPVETYDSITTAFVNGESMADVRIRYAESTYTLQDGDWGFRLSRRLGLPFFNIQNANPGTNWDQVFAGTRISVPSRDLVIPLDPVEGQRIVVDLQRRYLVAFEGDEIVFHWPISIGMPNAPTFPGIYQILSKVDVAFGSSFSLCNENAECGQWEMDHFMGIYQVGTGLTNGFHGTVRLPNGGTLRQGSLQLASTFGCVMSDEDQARLLYEWAETGTVVEMIDRDFPPESELGQQALEFIQSLNEA